MLETIQLLAQGFVVVFEPQNLLLIIAGCTLGLFIGAMPGLGSVNGVAILLPLTFLVPPTGAIIFLAAIYYGAMYGGAISSIMLGIPGASTAVATTFDGRPLAKQGMADKALIGAAVASFIGGSISVVLFTFFAPPLAHVALVFGAPEEFALMMLAFATFVGLGGDDRAGAAVLLSSRSVGVRVREREGRGESCRSAKTAWWSEAVSLRAGSGRPGRLGRPSAWLSRRLE